VALLVFATTADLLPHRHDNVDKRACTIRHLALIGLGPPALKLPLLTGVFWAIATSSSISVHSPFLLRVSFLAPPAV
jgi:hypothetical protein